jgi:hypothetical protein
MPSNYRQSDSIDQLATALSAAQRAMEGASKDSVNPSFHNKYADLSSIWAAIREPLGANGLSVIQMPSAEGARVTVTTLLAHSSGQWISSDLSLTVKDDSPQAIGIGITYARRYSLAAVGGVAPEDTDGEGAQPRAEDSRAQPKPKVQVRTAAPQESTGDLKASITTAAQGWLQKFIAAKHPEEFQRVMGLHGYQEIDQIPVVVEKAKLLFDDLRMALADLKKGSV